VSPLASWHGVGWTSERHFSQPSHRLVSQGWTESNSVDSRQNPDQRIWILADSLDIRHETTDQKGTELQAGLPPRTPRRMGCRPRCFNPSLPTRHATGSSPVPARGNPAPQGRAISVPLDPVTSGSSRSLTGASPGRSGRIEARIVQLPKLTVPVLTNTIMRTR
jgi:hypothetical protein